MDACRTHGDEFDVDSVVGVAQLEWPTSTFVVVIGFCFLALGIILSGFATESMSFYQFLGLPLAFVLTITMVKATVGIMINRGYYAKGPEWDTSLGPKPKPRSSAFVLTATLLFCLGTFAAYLYLKGVRPGVPLEPALDRLARPAALDVRRDDRDRRLLGPLLQAAPGAPLSLRSLP